MPSTPKSVLISLADNCNDHGHCFPSISKICERTCFRRTAVISAIQWLENNQYLIADRTNGRHTKYQIIVPGIPDTKPVRQTGRSAIRSGSRDEHYPFGRRTAPVRQTNSNRQQPSLTVTTTAPPDSDGLVFPGIPMQVSEQVVVVVMQMIYKARTKGLPCETCQDLLDELTGAMAAPRAEVRSPVSYLRGLISKAATGDFMANRGINIKQTRVSYIRTRAEAEAKAIEAAADKARRKTPEARAASNAARERAVADLNAREEGPSSLQHSS
jgi:hypothetical protein